MNWRQYGPNWVAFGRDRWLIKRIRHERYAVRLMRNGAFLALPNEGFCDSLAAAKATAEELDKKGFE